MRESKKIALLSLVAGAPLAMMSCAGSVESVEQGDKPNLLYIFPDQYRLHALSIWADPEYRALLTTNYDPVETPNIDRLAREGVLFTQATSTHPVSSPHRAMLLSGMYPHNNGIYDINCKLDREQELKHDIVCLTDVLYNEGYETAYFGKTHWHKSERLFDENGDFVNTLEAPGGHDIGAFDTYVPEGKSRHSNTYWFQQLNDNHFNAIAYSNRPELVEGKKDGEQYRPKEFTTTVEADHIIDYLENKDGERDATKPFSVIWSINPPHPPYTKVEHCHEEIFNEFYKDMPIDELLNRENVILDTKSGDNSGDSQQLGVRMNARVYFSLIRAVDEEIGRVLATLEEIGEEDNTIVIFTSDHGEMMGSHALTGKNSIHDESFLIPYIIKYPGVIKEHSTTDLLLGSIDIMPTLLSMMGMKSEIPATVEGRDYSKGIITGVYDEVEKPKSALYMRLDLRGVKTDKYTYVISQEGTYEIYDNEKDPYQMHSLKFEEIPAADVKMLKSELGYWLKNENRNDWYNTMRVRPDLVIYPEV